MIYFDEIFKRAVHLFADPDIEKKFILDPAGFHKDMLGFLMNGKDKFTSPTAVTDKLANYDASQGQVVTDNGDGTDTYTLGTSEGEVLPPNNGHVGMTFKIGKDFVSGTYNATTHKITFPRNVATTEQWTFAWFYAGAFTEDFSNCFRSDFPSNSIVEKIINILAYGLLAAWGDQEVGRALDVRNILTDTDFTMYSPANSARAKVEWRNQMNRDMDTLISELNWRVLSTPRGGSRFGK